MSFPCHVTNYFRLRNRLMPVPETSFTPPLVTKPTKLHPVLTWLLLRSFACFWVCTNKIKQYMVFCVWLLLFHITLVSSMLLYVAIIHPFLCSSVLCDYHNLLTHFAINGHSLSHPIVLLLGIFFVYTCVCIFIR